MADFGESDDFSNPNDEPENSNSQFPDGERPPGEDDVDYAIKPEKDTGNEEMYEIEAEDHIAIDALEGTTDPEERADPNPDDQEEGGDHEEKPEVEGEEGYGNNEYEEDDDEESDDDVQITIDVNKPQPATSGAYPGFNVKRGAPGSAPQGLGEKSKFTVEEFEGSMAINGVPAHEYSLESLEDKPWRKPGADITDYFNYGFNETTWLSYTERQRRMRMESGAGVPPSLGLGPPPKMPFNPTLGAPIMMVQQATTLPIPISVVNENSKYAGSVMVKKAGPPPARKMAGAIDVIGGGNLSSRRPETGVSPSSPNVDEPPDVQGEAPPVEKPPVNIDFSRPPPGFPNMTLPPPYGVPNMPNIPPPVLPPHPQMLMQPPPMVGDPYGSEFLPGPGAPGDDYFNQYSEPTQDSQWGSADWRGGPPMGMPPMGINAPGRSRDRPPRDRESLGTPPVPPGEESRSSSSRRRRSRSPAREERDKEGKDRDRDRESRDKRERDRRGGERGSGRDRDRSDRDGRDRSERRSRRHGRSRSRSRSPSSSHKRSSKRSKRDRSKSKSSSE